ncbi:MAG: 3-isopropylmalate dehydratase [Deltaproteobacteria bacterium]|nr:MAG: 3-isopropylmalate dehydratase [Deltaproteobacteria bacterium]
MGDTSTGRHPEETGPSDASNTRRTVKFRPKILFLTEDPELVRQQLKEGPIQWDPERPRMGNISTDEITPGWVCFHYDETLGHYVYAGLRGKCVEPGDVAAFGAEVVVSGLSKGCGSSREHAPYAEKYAGIRLVIADTIEKIYGQNCINIGMLVSTDLSLVPRILAGEEIPLETFTRGLDPISADIVRYGGLFEYNKARLAGDVSPPEITTGPRPMTLVEKIIARHAVADAATGKIGLPAVAPGDALFIRADVRFSHEYVTPMAAALFEEKFGAEAKVAEPESVFAFRDHLTFLGEVMPEAQRKMGLLEKASGLAETQAAFAERQGIRLYGEVPEGGSEAICHNAVLEDIGLPGQVIVGTDSHTCTAGALGAFAFGVGTTDMANLWYTRDVRVKVPETVRIHLYGARRPGVSAKDLMLFIMSHDYYKEGRAIGQVLEFTGPGLADLSMDERATLTNMAVEAGATTGIIEADERTLEWLEWVRPGVDLEAARAGILESDPDAHYAHQMEIDLSTVEPMVATPGDPRNGIPLSQLEANAGGKVRIDIAYGGSCTGGKMADMDMYASVLEQALAEGRKVADGVELYIQFGSQKIRRYAEEKGYIEIFEAAGVKLVNPSCGACIRAGPGVSTREETVTVSAINRNFPGRSGPGKVYLASPLVVAASAVAGYITAPSPPERDEAAA